MLRIVLAFMALSFATSARAFLHGQPVDAIETAYANDKAAVGSLPSPLLRAYGYERLATSDQAKRFSSVRDWMLVSAMDNYRRAGHRNEAAALASRLARDPSVQADAAARAHVLRGWYAYEAGDLEWSLVCYERARSLDPSYTTAAAGARDCRAAMKAASKKGKAKPFKLPIRGQIRP